MIFLLIILVAVVAAGAGAVGFRVLDRATRPGLTTPAPTALTRPQKMICPYDGLELSGDNELDLAVHLQCINMAKFSLQMEAEKRAEELFNQRVLALPPAPKWAVEINIHAGHGKLDYCYRWQVLRDGAVLETGWEPYPRRAQRRADQAMTELKRKGY